MSSMKSTTPRVLSNCAGLALLAVCGTLGSCVRSGPGEPDHLSLGRRVMRAVDFGLKADGVTDDGPAIERALAGVAGALVGYPEAIGKANAALKWRGGFVRGWNVIGQFPLGSGEANAKWQNFLDVPVGTRRGC